MRTYITVRLRPATAVLASALIGVGAGYSLYLIVSALGRLMEVFA